MRSHMFVLRISLFSWAFPVLRNVSKNRALRFEK